MCEYNFIAAQYFTTPLMVKTKQNSRNRKQWDRLFKFFMIFVDFKDCIKNVAILLICINKHIFSSFLNNIAYLCRDAAYPREHHVLYV